MRSSLTVGYDALRSNPLRTLLSTLGVVIGVASLVAVLSLGDGLELFARQQIGETTSVQFIEVAPQTSVLVDGVRVPQSGYPVFTPADAERLFREVPGLSQVRLSLMGTGRLMTGETVRGLIVVGTAGVPYAPDSIEAGRWFTRQELAAGERVAIVSPRLSEVAGGDSLLLEGQVWRIIGRMNGRPGDSLLRLMVPIGPAQQAMVRSEVPRAPTLLAKAARVEAVDSVRVRVEQWLAAQDTSWPATVRVSTNQARVQQARQAILVFKLAMGAITGISLLVGGIGIMNVLLASVAERTREIGVRRAAGARQRDILSQFLAESVAITTAGSLAGVLLGVTGAFGVSALIRSQTQADMFAAFTWGTAAVGVIAAVTVGFLFGMYPALRAARLSPIDAIRHE
jgi:putative ABC transport system permease protein